MKHIGQANRHKLERAKGQLKSALKLVDSVLEGKPHWPSSNITNAYQHSVNALRPLMDVITSPGAGLTKKQKRDNPDTP